MRSIRILYGVLALSIIASAMGCNSKQKAAEAERRKADSIAKVRKDSIASEERRRADSIATANPAPEETPPVAEPTVGKFHVVAGGFVIQSNADSYLEEMQRTFPDARIYTAPNGFKLVTIGHYASMAEAISMINSIRSQPSQDGRTDLWVYEEGGPYNTASWLSIKGESGYDEFNDTPPTPAPTPTTTTPTSAYDEFENFEE